MTRNKTAVAVFLLASLLLVVLPLVAQAQAPTPTPTAGATIGEQVASIGEHLVLVITYDPNDAQDPWKIYDPTAPAFANDLQRLQAGNGYWMSVSAAATLTYGGNRYNLTPGWNLVGWIGPASATATPTTRPTATPTPEATGRILFEDNFDDNHNGWSLTATADGLQGYLEGGRYHLVSDNTNIAATAWTRAPGDFGDFSYEVAVTKIAGSDDYAYGIKFRHTSAGHYAFAITGTGLFALLKYHFNPQTGTYVAERLLGWAPFSAINRGNSTNRLKVVAEGNSIDMVINDQRIMQVVERDFFSSGSIALYTDRPHVAFDYVVVRDLATGAASPTPTPQPTPTPTATPTPADRFTTTALEDSFDDNRNGWVPGPDAQAYFEGGRYHVTGIDGNAASYANLPQEFTNFSYEATVTKIEGPDNRAYGLLFRWQRAVGFYRFYIAGNGNYRLTRSVWDSNANTYRDEIIDGAPSVAIKQGNETNVLKVIADGQAIRLFVNDQYLETITDNSFSSGMIGIITDTPHVAFDHVIVRVQQGALPPPTPMPTSTPTPSRATPLPTPTPSAGVAPPSSVADAVARAMPAVVRIEVRTNLGTSVGSGFIIDSQGNIVTSNHVVEDSNTATVTLPDGRTFTGTVVGRDATADISVVRITGTNLPTVAMGNSDALRLGEDVIAIGYPLAFSLSGGPTITRGIVSAVRYDPRLGVSVIQTDAAINPGNSGGPLINLWGEVVGINTYVLRTEGVYAEGMGFAISINSATPVIQRLITVR